MKTKIKMTAEQLKAFTDAMQGKANPEGVAEVKNLITKGVEVMPAEKREATEKFLKSILLCEKGINTGTESEGGVLVPQEVANDVIEIIPQYGFITAKSTLKKMRSSSMKISSVGGNVTVGFVGEAQAIGEVAIDFTPVTLEAKALKAIVVISNEEIADAVVDVVALVEGILAKAIASALDSVAFNGGGGFTGLKTLPGLGQVTVADADVTDSEKVADALIDLQTSIGGHALANGIYVTSLAGWGKMRKLRDGNGNLLGRGAGKITDGNTPNNGFKLAGYFDEREVYVLTQITDGFTTDSVPFYYGDFQYLVTGIRNELSLYPTKDGTVDGVNMFETDQTAVRAISRVDMGVASVSAFARLKVVA